MNQDRKRKVSDSHNDDIALRRFTTEQRIEIENLNVQRQGMIDRQHESRVVALSIEESAIGSQIEHAERRAVARCANYDKTNVHWQRVDGLLSKQDDVMKKTCELNNKKQPSVEKVTKFLNESSP